MGKTGQFAALLTSVEYHATQELLFTYSDGACGEVKGISLAGLCGVFISSNTRTDGVDVGGRPEIRLYDSPPAGLIFCKSCARLKVKRKGWLRLLSHLFHHRRGFRAATRSFGRHI